MGAKEAEWNIKLSDEREETVQVGPSVVFASVLLLEFLAEGRNVYRSWKAKNEGAKENIRDRLYTMKKKAAAEEGSRGRGEVRGYVGRQSRCRFQVNSEP